MSYLNSFPSTLVTKDHCFSIDEAASFDELIKGALERQQFSIEYDGGASNFNEKCAILMDRYPLPFLIRGAYDIFCRVSIRSVGFDFMHQRYAWGSPGFRVDVINELRCFVVGLFGNSPILASPAGGHYPAGWVAELSAEGLLIDEIILKLGIENFVKNPDPDYDVSENMTRIIILDY